MSMDYYGNLSELNESSKKTAVVHLRTFISCHRSIIYRCDHHHYHHYYWRADVVVTVITRLHLLLLLLAMN